MDIKILYEDEDLLVLDKPSFLTVNKSDTTVGEMTVQDWVEEKFSFIKLSTTDKESDFYKRAGIVHRIDKETSGILIVAKSPVAFQNLQSQFKTRKVKKTYVALVHGKVIPASGEISVPVGRLPWNRKMFGIVAGGREAVTKYKVLSVKYLLSGKVKEPLTLLELSPETGRTHQIRVHLKYFNHPIFSDFLYGGRKVSRQDRKFLPRVFLHAAKISFFNPKTNELISFESKLPVELNNFLEFLIP